jgi:hypothetical protein
MSTFKSIHGEITDARNLSAFSLKQLVEIYNQLTGKSLKKFDRKPVALDRTAAALAEWQAANPPAPKAKAKAKAKRGRRALYAPEAKIKMLVDGNPCRAGTGCWMMYNFLRDGMTFAEFEAKVKAGKATGEHALQRMSPGNELHYFVKKGAVEVK